MSNRIPTNVRRGAAFLDERLPGWRKRIRLDELDLSSGCNCVLGQTLGGYDEGKELLGLSEREVERYGFWRHGRQSFESLTEGWRKVLAR